MKRTVTARILLLTILWCVSWTNVPAQQQRRETGEPNETLIRNATLLTVTRGTLENSDILIRRGKIGAIGKGLKASATPA